MQLSNTHRSTYIMWKSLAHNNAHGPMAAAYRNKGEEASVESRTSPNDVLPAAPEPVHTHAPAQTTTGHPVEPAPEMSQRNVWLGGDIQSLYCFPSHSTAPTPTGSRFWCGITPTALPNTKLMTGRREENGNFVYMDGKIMRAWMDDVIIPQDRFNNALVWSTFPCLVGEW